MFNVAHDDQTYFRKEHQKTLYTTRVYLISFSYKQTATHTFRYTPHFAKPVHREVAIFKPTCVHRR